MTSKTPSGRFVLRLPKDLHLRLRNLAKHSGKSLNEICVERLGSDRPEPIDHPAIDPKICEEIRSSWSGQVEGIVLFGSASRGEQTETSDTDILIVLKKGATLSRTLYSEWDRKVAPITRERSSRDVSPQFVILPDDPFEAGGIWYEAAIEGQVLWERDSVVSSFLRRVREKVAAGELVRAFSHGHPYWIKKKVG